VLDGSFSHTEPLGPDVIEGASFTSVTLNVTDNSSVNPPESVTTTVNV